MGLNTAMPALLTSASMRPLVASTRASGVALEGVGGRVGISGGVVLEGVLECGMIAISLKKGQSN